MECGNQKSRRASLVVFPNFWTTVVLQNAKAWTSHLGTLYTTGVERQWIPTQGMPFRHVVPHFMFRSQVRCKLCPWGGPAGFSANYSRCRLHLQEDHGLFKEEDDTDMNDASSEVTVSSVSSADSLGPSASHTGTCVGIFSRHHRCLPSITNPEETHSGPDACDKLHGLLI